MAITKFIPQIWSAALLEAFHASAVVTPSVTHEYEGEARRGNTVHISTVTTPTIQDYSATRTIDPEDLADTQVDLAIDQEKAFGFYVDDIDRTQAAGSFDAVTTDAGMALVEDAESYLLGLMVSGGTNANGGTTPVTVADGATAFDAVKACRTALGNAKVPMSGRYLAVNSDFAGFLLGADSKLTNVNEAGNAGELRNGVLGNLLGFTVVETPLLNTAKPTCVGYHRSGAAFVSQIDQTEALRAQTKFADIVRGLHVYGAKVLRPTAVQVFASQ